jgi:hypothetical protein
MQRWIGREGRRATCLSDGATIWTRVSIGSGEEGVDTVAAMSSARRSTEGRDTTPTVVSRMMGEGGVEVVSEARDPLPNSPGRPGAQTLGGEVATMAVSMPACMVTIGGHPSAVSEGE